MKGKGAIARYKRAFLPKSQHPMSTWQIEAMCPAQQMNEALWMTCELYMRIWYESVIRSSRLHDNAAFDEHLRIKLLMLGCDKGLQ